MKRVLSIVILFTECDYEKVTNGQCVYKSGNLCFLCGQPKDLNSGGILKIRENIE